MAKLELKLETQTKKASSKRPKSLITRIPTEIRDSLNISLNDTLIWEVYEENTEKYIKIYKKED